MTLHETLKAMRELLADEKRWTQFANARVRPDDPVGTYSTNPYATCWCLAGAAFKVLGGPGTASAQLWPSLEALFGYRPECDSLVAFNDTHTHAEVLAKLDDAIKATAP